MGNKEGRAGMSKFDKILITVGTIGGIFGTIMAFYLDPIKDKIKNLDTDIKEVRTSTNNKIKVNCDNNTVRFNKLENDIKDIEKENRAERKETNQRLRSLENGQATILEKINSLKKGG